MTEALGFYRKGNPGSSPESEMFGQSHRNCVGSNHRAAANAGGGVGNGNVAEGFAHTESGNSALAARDAAYGLAWAHSVTLAVLKCVGIDWDP